MSNAYKEKRKKGLCFHSDEKYSLEHCCKREELMLCTANVDKENQFNEKNELEEEVEANTFKVAMNVGQAQVSASFSTPRTMKLKGKIANRDVVV